MAIDTDLFNELLAEVQGRKDAFVANAERIEREHQAATIRARDEVALTAASLRRRGFRVYDGGTSSVRNES